MQDLFPHETHIETLAGLPVVDFQPGRPLENPEGTAYRLTLYGDDGLPDGLVMLGCFGVLIALVAAIIYAILTGNVGIALLGFFVVSIMVTVVPQVIWARLFKKSNCPYCGEPLPDRTAVACNSCGVQWGTAEEPFYDGRGQNTKEESPIRRQLEHFIKAEGSERVAGLIVSSYDHSVDFTTDEIVEILVEKSDHFRGLRAIFLSEMTPEECEISWIINGDVSPILAIYSRLEHFQIRGGGELSLGELRHERLQRLIIESGGLSSLVVEEIARADLPSLEMLEIWTGSELYTCDVTEQQLVDMIEACDSRFLQLKHLAVRNCELADEVAQRVFSLPLAARLEVIDLSLGTLTDVGARAILDAYNAGKLPNLRRLDIHYHFVDDEEILDSLSNLPIETDLHPCGAEHAAEDERYSAVGE